MECFTSREEKIMGKKVSIIVPAYNAEKTLQDCIDSIDNQDYPKKEIIIVDDGSKDATWEIANLMSKKKTNVIAVHQSNQGVSAARNKGISLAKGEFVMFVDADDIVLPNMIKTLMKYQKLYNADLVKSGLCRVEKNKNVHFETCKNISFYATRTEIFNNFFCILSSGLNSPVGKIYRLSIIKEKNIKFDEKLDLSEDLFFNLTYLESVNNALWIPEIFYKYYTYNSILTKKYREKLFDRRKKTIDLCEKYLRKSNLNRDIVYYLYIKLLFAAAIQEVEYGKRRSERLDKINSNLSCTEVIKAIEKMQPQGITENVLYYIAKNKQATQIDRFAKIIIGIKKIRFFKISRISV